MIYIPSFWFHKVLTMEDNSVNVNLNFHRLPKENPNQRNTDLILLHRLFATTLWRTDDATRCAYSDVPYSLSLVWTVTKEWLPLAVFVGLLTMKWSTRAIITTILLLYFIIVPLTKVSTYGVSELYTAAVVFGLLVGQIIRRISRC